MVFSWIKTIRQHNHVSLPSKNMYRIRRQIINSLNFIKRCRKSGGSSFFCSCCKWVLITVLEFMKNRFIKNMLILSNEKNFVQMNKNRTCIITSTESLQIFGTDIPSTSTTRARLQIWNRREKNIEHFSCWFYSLRLLWKRNSCLSNIHQYIPDSNDS